MNAERATRGAPRRTVFGPVIGAQPTRKLDIVVPLLDPSTGSAWGEVHSSVSAIDQAVASASKAFKVGSWRHLSQPDRSSALRHLASLAEKHAEDFSTYETLATGKTVRATAHEAEGLAKWLRFFAGAAEARTWSSVGLHQFADATIREEPVGVVAAITPYNGALSLGAWKVAPALAVGNTVVLKPPMEAPASSQLLGELALQAGLPEGVLNVVPGDGLAGKALVSHPDVALVCFTGSTQAARAVGSEASSRFKRLVVEAGGKSAQIVFTDCDIEAALSGVVKGVFDNAGQSCVAGSRLLVEGTIYDEFVEALVERAKSLQVGDPFDRRSEVGPLGNRKQYEKVCKVVEDAEAAGIECLSGGAPARLPGALASGFFYQPTVVVAATESELWREEIFGPVVAVMPFKTDAEAVQLANDTQYGLAAGLWTESLSRAKAISAELEAGTVWINTYREFDCRLPFGGYKQSGVGRENGASSLAEMLNVKTIVTRYK